ncbi:MAG: hypothetical protein RSB71_00510 [Bacilli bacterium]
MKVVNILKKSLIVLCSILIFSLIIITMFITSNKKLVTKDNLTLYAKNTEVLKLNLKFIIKEDVTLEEKIKELGKSAGIPEDIVFDILKSNELKELFGEFFSKTIDYVINGGKRPVLEKQTVTNITKVATDSLERHLNIVLEKETLVRYIEKYTTDITSIIPNRSEIINNQYFVYMQDILKFNTLYLYFALLGLIILTGLLSKSAYKPLKYLGISMLLGGLIFVIIGSCYGLINPYIVKNIIDLELVSSLVRSILNLWFKIGVFVSFTSVIILLIYIAITRIIRHNRKLDQTIRYNINDIKL